MQEPGRKLYTHKERGDILREPEFRFCVIMLTTEEALNNNF